MPGTRGGHNALPLSARGPFRDPLVTVFLNCGPLYLRPWQNPRFALAGNRGLSRQQTQKRFLAPPPGAGCRLIVSSCQKGQPGGLLYQTLQLCPV